MTKDGKKILMLLGGIYYLKPAIEAAHEQGYYVITADYLPNNIAHQWSDEYVNVDITDKDAVLNIARDKNIDGILSFAVDPGVVTAAYVQEQLNLPSMGPYKSVLILQNKDLFRIFLRENGFHVPWSKSYSKMDEALIDASSLPLPVMVKPTDSAGSKGVSRVAAPDQYVEALNYAFRNSKQHRVIVEQFIEPLGCSSDSDCFSENGTLKVVSFSAQRFDKKAVNPFAPAAFTWPSTYTPEQENYLRNELQRLLTLLGMKTSLYNVETRIGVDGKPYIMEVSPRAGGNRLAEMLRYATGTDIITVAVRCAVGEVVEEIKLLPYTNYIAYVVLHSQKDGVFEDIKIDEAFYAKHKLENLNLWVKNGDSVSAFTGANTTIGTLPLKFESKGEMLLFIQDLEKYINVIVV